MVQKTQIAQVSLDLSHPFFSYLKPEDVLELFSIENKLAQLEVYENGYLRFVVIYENTSEHVLHVRELAGHFMHRKNLLQTMTINLARLLHKRLVTAYTENETLKKIYLSLGWKKFENNDDFYIEAK